jgi:hypothetical protein
MLIDDRARFDRPAVVADDEVVDIILPLFRFVKKQKE